MTVPPFIVTRDKREMARSAADLVTGLQMKFLSAALREIRRKNRDSL
jgi:hypothetical protein